MKEKKVSTLRGPAQLADLQGALCVPAYNFTLLSSDPSLPTGGGVEGALC